VVSLAAVESAHAQLNTQHIKGTVGLKGGSQPPPHWYVVGPLVYTYNTDTVRLRDGEKFPVNADITIALYGAGINKVTTKKILGGFYGFSVLFAGVNNRIQGTEIDLNPGGGLTDTVAQPISLGWHFPRADVTASYSLYLPTGRYSHGATDNLGLGMWGHEPAVGATVYFDKARQYHAATVASITFQSEKEGSDTQVGTAMNFEGGVGADFLKGGLTTGLVYYGSFKLEEDRIDGIPGILIRGKNSVFALGPEVSLALARKGVLYGFLKVNYQWEVYSRTNTQGDEFLLTLSFPVRPIKLPGS
jgi:hypothetical protein